MEQTYNVVFTGQLKEGTDPEVVSRDFCRKFNFDQQAFAEKLASGKPLILKRNATRAIAEEFQHYLDKIGMVTEVQPTTSAGTPDAGLPRHESPPNPANSNIAGNPYQRLSRRDTVSEFDQKSDQQTERKGQGDYSGPATVAASRGLSWLSEGWSDYVKPSIGGWIGALVVLVVLFMVISLIPLIGGLAANLLAPIFTAGLMLGARRQERGEAFSVNDVFSAFNGNKSQLVMVGVLYMLGVLAITLVGVVLIGGSLFAVGGFGGEQEASTALHNPFSYILPLLLLVLLIVPLAMAYWFAPALVALRGLSASEAMKESFKGCIRNVMPFLVYGLVGMVLSFVAAIPLMLGFLILMPVMVASMYVAYKDIFESGALTV